MSEQAIRCSDINIKLGKFEMKDLSFEIKRGYVTGLIGRSGAGKTTLINMIAGVIEPESGFISYDGLMWYEDNENIRKKISVVYDAPNFSMRTTAKKLAKSIKSIEKDFDMEYFDRKMQNMQLDENMKFQKYSSGMMKKFMLIMAISRRPEILILDEPTSNVDPISRVDMIDMLHEFVENENNTILFSTHITSDLDKIADYIMMIDDGQIVLYDETENLRDIYSGNQKQLTIEEIMYEVVKEGTGK